MVFSPKHLTQGERIELELHTHVKQIVLPLVILVVASAAAIAGGAFWDYQWGRLGIAVAWLLVVLIFVLVPVWRWRSTLYVITNRRLITRRGIISKSGRDIPLYRISDVAYEKGLTDRILGCGTLIVSDASDQDGLKLDDIPHVEDVQVRLNELLFEHDNGTDVEGSFPPGDPRADRRRPF
ncbi:PH domain-containing protein [Dermatophilaceae bacterium Sec6.4]